MKQNRKLFLKCDFRFSVRASEQTALLPQSKRIHVFGPRFRGPLFCVACSDARTENLKPHLVNNVRSISQIRSQISVSRGRLNRPPLETRFSKTNTCFRLNPLVRTGLQKVLRLTMFQPATANLGERPGAFFDLPVAIVQLKPCSASGYLFSPIWCDQAWSHRHGCKTWSHQIDMSLTVKLRIVEAEMGSGTCDFLVAVVHELKRDRLR